MKKILFFLFMLFVVVAGAFAQGRELSVQSFEEKPFDTTANDPRYKLKDGNGEFFSIIKLSSTAADDDLRAYSFDFGYCESRVKEVNGEVWLYVQRNAMRVTITREGYKPLTYELNTTVQQARVYAMTLSVAPKTTQRQFLVFEISPADSEAIITYKKANSDDEYKPFGNGKLDEGGRSAKNMELGAYAYKIISTNYHVSEGMITLDTPNAKHLEKVTLRPNFANVTLSSVDGAEIYIDEEKVGEGSWSGKLSPGKYVVECRKASHKSSVETITVEEGKDFALQLQEPTPITGQLSLTSAPLGAKIVIDGKAYGETPDFITGLSIGERKVELSYPGYRTETITATIRENEVAEYSVELTKGSAKTAETTAKVAKEAVAATVDDDAPVMYNSDGTRRVIKNKTVAGVVIDKNGYPVVGATVQATGGKESTTVGEDGTFLFEVPETLESITVKHKGYLKKKQKIEENYEMDMVFHMKKDTKWFINVFFLGGQSPVEETAGIGLMFGQTMNWGWYAKTSIDFISDEPLPSISAGLTKRLTNLFHLYAGLGYVYYIDWTPYEFPNNYYDMMMFDLGFLIKPHKNFNINIGTSLFTDFDKFGFSVNVGLGVSF